MENKIGDSDLWFNSQPKCPFCGHDNYLETEDYPSEGDEATFECAKCEKEFKYVMNIEITFNSEQ